MIDNLQDLYVYLKCNGKDDTWKSIGEKTGLTERQARHYGTAYLNTPDEEGIIYTRDEAIRTAEDPESMDDIFIPKGLEVIRANKGVNGKWTYSAKVIPPAVDYKKLIDEALHGRKTTISTKSVQTDNEFILAIGDVHIGMDSKGTPFNQPWNEQILNERIDSMLAHVPKGKTNFIQLGDYADGERGKTASNTHKLPQNMSDQEIFRVGFSVGVRIIESLMKKGEVEVFWLTNSNHPTVVDWQIGYALSQFFRDIKFHLLDEVYNLVNINGWEVCLAHGKDREFIKVPLPVKLTPEKATGIDRLFKTDKKILIRADRHQFNFDKPLFLDLVLPAFSVGSGWVANNFLNPEPGGFVKGYIGQEITITPIFF